MLFLYIEAPFAVCRTFTAGWYRPTATFLTPSAAYGLLLNLAGLETRLREEDPQFPAKCKVPTSLMRPGLPKLRIALGAPALRPMRNREGDVPETDPYPRVQTVYQQIHNYPVGSSGGDRAATTFGSKYNIAPVRREILVGLRAAVAVECDPELVQRIQSGVRGEPANDRYGLPFIGDNAFLPDRIEVLDYLPPVHWYERITDEQSAIRPRSARLTIWIDRTEMSRTTSALYAPVADPSRDVPIGAWTEVGPI